MPTLVGPRFVPSVTPITEERSYVRFVGVVQDQPDGKFGLDNPTSASTAASDHPSRRANDGSPATFWQAAAGDAAPWLYVDPERVLKYRSIRIAFPQAAAYGFVAEVRGIDGNWQKVAEQAVGADSRREREVTTDPVIGGRLRITLKAPAGSGAGAIVGLAEVSITGQLQNR